MRVLAVDPGGTTGMARYVSEDCAVEDCEHFQSWAVEGQMAAVERVRTEASYRLDALVVERFTITTATARKTRGGSNTAIEIVGALRWIAHARGIPFYEQAPSDAMAFMTDEKLRRLGWYTPGADHARDAARHLALYLIRTGLVAGERVVPSSDAPREET